MEKRWCLITPFKSDWFKSASQQTQLPCVQGIWHGHSFPWSSHSQTWNLSLTCSGVVWHLWFVSTKLSFPFSSRLVAIWVGVLIDMLWSVLQKILGFMLSLDQVNCCIHCIHCQDIWLFLGLLIQLYQALLFSSMSSMRACCHVFSAYALFHLHFLGCLSLYAFCL